MRRESERNAKLMQRADRKIRYHKIRDEYNDMFIQDMDDLVISANQRKIFTREHHYNSSWQDYYSSFTFHLANPYYSKLGGKALGLWSVTSLKIMNLLWSMIEHS